MDQREVCDQSCGSYLTGRGSVAYKGHAFSDILWRRAHSLLSCLTDVINFQLLICRKQGRLGIPERPESVVCRRLGRYHTLMKISGSDTNVHRVYQLPCQISEDDGDAWIRLISMHLVISYKLDLRVTRHLAMLLDRCLRAKRVHSERGLAKRTCQP